MIVKITQHELLRRINQKIAKNIEGVTESRDGESHNETDEYFTIEFDQNKITTTNVDLEKLGKELGVLKDFEKLED
jgi:hypothetical protein